MSVTEPEWKVWDDGLNFASATRIRDWRRGMDGHAYEFRIKDSEHHKGMFQVEGKKRGGVQ